MPIDNYLGFSRAIDLDGQLIEFYISESIVKSIHMMNFIINDLIIEKFNPNELEVFPSKANVKNIGLEIPEAITERLSKSTLEQPMLRFGKKGGDPKWIKRGFPDIQSQWRIDFENNLWRVNDFNNLK